MLFTQICRIFDEVYLEDFYPLATLLVTNWYLILSDVFELISDLSDLQLCCMLPSHSVLLSVPMYIVYC